jgi:hypothetical protein
MLVLTLPLALLYLGGLLLVWLLQAGRSKKSRAGGV